jgi:hypothetical protein
VERGAVSREGRLAGILGRRVFQSFFAVGVLRRAGAFALYVADRGHASAYRGRDDLQRAASADLVLQWLAGVRPHAAGITIDPLPAGIELLTVDNLRLRGRELRVEILGDVVRATADGTLHESLMGEAIEIAD